MRERLSRKLFSIKVKRLKYTIEGFKKIIQPLSVASITFDNGVENIRYQELGIPSYFCNPYHSWEKGSVEQGIGLIREYIPKKADLKDFSQEKIDAILERINNTPMKCLKYKTPNEIYSQNLLFPNWLQVVHFRAEFGDRIYIEAGNKATFKDIDLFTFEPHIKKKQGNYGFKHENIYYFDKKKLEIL